MQLKRANEQHQRTNLQPVSPQQTFPGDMKQIDLIGPLQLPIYKNALTGVDVFSNYFFAVPLTNASVNTVARELVKNFLNHSYIPKTILSDFRTNFTSCLIHELYSIPEIRLKHATLKHPQTIGTVESHKRP